MPRSLCVLALGVVFLVGCSGPTPIDDAGETGVASVATASATASASAVAVDDRRPLIRFDTSEDEKTRLFQAWTHCLVTEGGSQWSEPKRVMNAPGAATDPKNTAVLAACRAHEPEDEDVREARTDPAAYREHNREWYRCAKAKGYALTTPDPDTGEFGLTRVGPNGDFGSAKITACKVKAFGWK
jgi:hypothetical protein